MAADLEFRLPDVGEGIAEADLVRWLVAEGDRVREHQDLAEVQTDKAVVVIGCPATGIVERLAVQEGDTVQVGEVLAVFAPDQARGGGPVGMRAPLGDGAGPPAPAAADAAQVAPAAAPSRPLAAPATRKLARDLGVDLAEVAGSGPQGRITREDVRSAADGDGPGRRAPAPGAGRPDGGATTAAPAPVVAVPGEVVPLRGTRRAIALALTRAQQEVPRVIDYREVDATALLDARRRLKAAAERRGDLALARALTPTPLIVAATVRALREHPYANASIDLDAQTITLHREVHVGLAVAAPSGLTVPVLERADALGLDAIAQGCAELTRAAREQRLRPDQLQGATATVNNYGALGIWLGTPLVVPPQVVNVGVGAIRDQVVPVDGVPAVRPVFALAVAGDHRVLDADTLAAFVGRVVELLEDPLLLLGGA